jgi:hypothetical protein
MPISDVDDLIVATNIIRKRLSVANNAIQPVLIEPHLNFIHSYTSIDAGAFSGIIDEKQRLKRFLEDTINFFVGLPISVAADTWKHSVRAKEPIGMVVKEMLESHSFGICAEKLATTGFGVFRAKFAEVNPADLSRGEHRKRLGASEGDPEMIQVSFQGGEFSYSLAAWAAQALTSRLIEQNKNWPHDESLSRLETGNMIDLPGPISAGCPVRKASIRPLCEYLSQQITLDR